MAGILLGAGSGLLAGAAVYYTLSTQIQQNTAVLRAELASSNRVLETSLDPVPPPAASSRVGPAYPAQAPFSELLRHKWNAAVGSAVAGVRDANWRELGAAAVGAAQDAAGRIGAAGAVAGEAATNAATNAASKVADAAHSAAQPVKEAIPDAADISAAAEAAREKARLAKLRHETDVDAPLQASPKITTVPKRLV